MANIIEKYIQFSVPREELGEDVCAVQAGILKECRSAVLTALGISQLPDNDEKKIYAVNLYDGIIRCVEKRYDSYQQFQEALAPFLEQAGKITSPRDDGEGAFIPPHCFLVRTAESLKGRTDIGLLKWRYIGHGLHESILKPV